MEKVEESITLALVDGRRYKRRNSYVVAIEENNMIEEPDEMTRKRSVVARWNRQNIGTPRTGVNKSHESSSSSDSSTSSLRHPVFRGVNRTSSSSGISRTLSINEITLPEVSRVSTDVTTQLTKSNFIGRKTTIECNCRKDSLASSARGSSTYSIKRQDSGYSISTCQSILAPSSVRNSVNTLNASHDGRLLNYQQISDYASRASERRHSDQSFSRLCKNDHRRLSDQTFIRNKFHDVTNVVGSSNLRTYCVQAIQRREQGKLDSGKVRCNIPDAKIVLEDEKLGIVKNGAKIRRPSLARRDSESSIRSSYRGSVGPVTPKMLRRRFSEQLILEGGLRNEPEFDDLLAEDQNDPEESLNVANARKKVTLKRHYYPEGNWGYAVTFVAVIIHSICHGLQLGSGVILLPAVTRYNANIGDVGKVFSCKEHYNRL